MSVTAFAIAHPASTQVGQVESLAALVTRAADKLHAAKDSAEMIDAGRQATAAYDTAKIAARMAKAHRHLVDAAHQMQADALEIEAMALRRLADEYDGAQERGEVAGHGGDRKINLPDGKVEEIGLTHKQIHEARQIRDAEEADPGLVRRTLDALLADGKEPTRAAVKRATKRKPSQQPEEPAIMECAEITGDEDAPAKRYSGAKTFVPDGQDLVELCKRGIALEEQGQTIEAVATELGLASNAYRISRQIVFLVDRPELSSADQAVVTKAISILKTTHQYTKAWEIAEPVAQRVWGTPQRGDRLLSLAGRRIEQFERTFGIVMQSCLTTDEVQLPYLSRQQSEECAKEIGRARKALAMFATRIQEIHR